jgi:hypothetical protein
MDKENLPENIEIKRKLERGGYDMSHKYGLIVERGKDYALADIRLFEKQVVIPNKTKENESSIKSLVKVLSEESIPYRQFWEGKR